MMGLLMRQKMDLTDTALADMPAVHAARARVEIAQAAFEGAQQALRACCLAQGQGDQHASTTSRPPIDYQEVRRQRRLEEPLRNALDDREIELHDAMRELTAAEKAARAEILTARHAGLKALAGELFESLAQVAAVNAKVWDYEVTTAALIEERPSAAVVAWPEFISEPRLRENLVEFRARQLSEVGLL